jgi:hypothetical protein
MADYSVLIMNKVAAQDVGAYNRSAVAGSAVDIENGFVFRLDSYSATAGQSEVWAATAPTASGSTLNDLWMACAPEVPLTVDGTLKYKGMNADPRRFYIPGGDVFDAFKPVAGDIITLTADAFNDATQEAYANATDGEYYLTWGASQTASSLSLKYLATTYISIGSGAIDNQRVTAYKFVVLAN